MAEITSRSAITTTKHHPTQMKVETIGLGKAVEWDGKDIVPELDAVPVCSWWSGGVTITPEDVEGGVSPTITSRFDVVAARSAEGPERRTRWVPAGTAMGLESGHFNADLQQLPAGSWWDGKLRLFPAREKGKPGR
ncbi:hypothetical protein ATSB10_20690 [Dyella thiooxydans]|uniref:Uncharacterized protein n=1 Tax=Dyella thiooxydans TaxID=445710 RepID=A0A160N137_9GAMM|nr:hypothetical protein [Dyella thiooxydans]AND69523.1 hypothetical protein ATSB10_20690 [Dyella thiooxydans]